MRRAGLSAIGFILLILLASCVHRKETDDPVKRTVLVYIAADNNLHGNANPNIYSMNSSIRNGMKGANLLVYVDRYNKKPALLHIHDNKIDTLISYKERNSTDPAVLAELIDYMKTNWPADSYGLILWSHGTGWIPTSQLHFVAPNLNYAQSREGGSTPVSYNPVLNQRYPRSYFTKAFALEERPQKDPPYECMEISWLAWAIPDGLFDYIAFDACYMGNVEVLYELRKKARYIVSSCYEIVSYGFPYHIVTRDFLNGNLMKVCREFFNYYNGMSGWERMGGISLVKTEGLDSLANCFSKIVAEQKELIPDMDVSKIQHFDTFRNHVFYDLEDFVDNLGTNNDYKKEFQAQLEKCIPYKITTPYIFPDDVDSIKVNKFCGLSVYIPLRKYESAGLNDDYRKLEWSIDTGY